MGIQSLLIGYLAIWVVVSMVTSQNSGMMHLYKQNLNTIVLNTV